MARNAVQALVFDVYGTLFDVASLERLAEERFPGRGGELSRLWRSKQLEYTWLLSLMGRYEDFEEVTRRALRYAAKALGLSLDEALEVRFLQAYRSLPPFPEVPEALGSLAERFPLAVLSNGTPAMLHDLLEDSGLAPYFRYVLSADAVGVYKPSPRVYRLALDAFRLPVEAIGFVTANAWDALGAAAFGFKVFWVNRAGQPEEAWEPPPHRVVRGLEALLEP